MTECPVRVRDILFLVRSISIKVYKIVIKILFRGA
jgi:hypothetical protein